MERDYTKKEILEIVEKTAAKYGIPKDDFLRASYIETGGQFNERAFNNGSKAAGLYQFLPSTAAAYGIRGREFDPNVNADAGARFYLDNQKQIIANHNKTGRPYLSGEDKPNGLDMYVAHQQGAGGYASIQAAIATGSFSRKDTRGNILDNIGDDLKAVTGVTRAQFNAMSDKDVATTFVKYWETKYERISIPEVGITPKTPGQSPGVPLQSNTTPSAKPMADGVLELGEKGPEVKKVQEQLIALGYKGADGKPLVPDSDFGDNTKFAVEAFQRASKIGVDGKAGEDTLEALKKAVPAQTSTAPTQGGNGNWPAPGNFKINDADKPGEGHGEFGTARSNRSGKHSGLDIQGKLGDPIEPFAAGKVVYAGPATGYGNTVVIDHGNGVRTLYAHLDKINVSKDQTVTPDTKIATMGRSGNTPKTGDTHLHFEVRTDARAGEPFSGKAVDPLPYLKNTKHIEAGSGNQNALADGVLKQDEKGPAVKQLQEQLNRLGIKDAQGRSLNPDSDFGDRTRQAVEAFQRSRGIEVDGKVGKDTFAELKKAEAEKTATVSPPAASKPDAAILLSNGKHADNPMYQQADALLAKLPTGTFKSEQERHNAAAAVTYEARVSGMTKIDAIVENGSKTGFIATQGDPKTTGDRVLVQKDAAVATPIEKSTKMIEQDAPAPLAVNPVAEQEKKRTMIV